LNLFYDKVFAKFLFDHPELLSMLALVEQFGITGHKESSTTESPARQQREFRQVEARPGATPPVPARSTIAVAKLSRSLGIGLKMQVEAKKAVA